MSTLNEKIDKNYIEYVEKFEELIEKLAKGKKELVKENDVEELIRKVNERIGDFVEELAKETQELYTHLELDFYKDSLKNEE